MNCFQLLFALEVWLIICSELKSLILFFFSRGFNFTLSVKVSCDANCIDNGDDDDTGLLILKYIIIKKL